MMVFIGFITVACLILIGLWSFISLGVKSDDKFIFNIFIGLIILTAIALGAAIEDFVNYKTPEAIDVYRGNAALKITNTVVDSVMVKSNILVIFNVK